MEQGYRVVPVNPNHATILGQTSYPSLSSIPAGLRLDIVDVFRRSEAVAGIAEEALARGGAFFFMQKGGVGAAAAARLEAAGIGGGVGRGGVVGDERGG